MLLLLFQIGEDLYAIETQQVVEIVPMVMLRSVPNHLVAGVFNYRGNIVPAIDLCQLIYSKPSQVCYSTRMIMVQSVSSSKQVGLIAERVTETVKLEKAQPIEFTDFGELLLMDKGIVQLIRWEPLVLDVLTAGSTAERMVESAGFN